MRALFFTLLACMLSLGARAQTPYAVLDSLTSAIRSFQLKASGKNYSDETGTCELSFSEDNFSVFVSDRLAYHSVYKKVNGKEVLFLTENIDLAKAIAVELLPFQNDVGAIRIKFPERHLATQLYEEGKIVGNTNPEFLDFYFLKEAEGAAASRATDWINYNTLVHLCHLMQQEKGLIDGQYIATATSEFNNVIDSNGSPISLLKEFLNKYQSRGSLYYNQVRKAYDGLSKDRDLVLKYFDSLSTAYKFRTNLTVEEFRSFNPEAGVLFNTAPYTSGSTSVAQLYSGSFKSIGPQFCKIRNQRLVEYIVYLQYNNKKAEKTIAFYTSIVNDLKRNVPRNFLKVLPTYGEHPQVFVFHPDLPYAIIVTADLVEGSYRFDKDTYVSISFVADEWIINMLKKGRYAQYPLLDYEG